MDGLKKTEALRKLGRLRLRLEEDDAARHHFLQFAGPHCAYWRGEDRKKLRDLIAELESQLLEAGSRFLS